MSEEKETLQLAVEGRIYETNYTKKFRNRPVWQAPNPNEIKAGIPGTILEVNVAEGDTVNEGDVLLMFVAMKMNNSIKAPFSGKIKKVYVENNQVFKKGELLVEFE